MQMKICLHIPVKGLREAVLAALPDADLTGTPADAEIVIGNPPMEALESNANLRLLQLHSAGTGRYPELYRTHPHLAICCATGAYGHTVAEHMFASLLCLMKHLNEYAVQQQTARWKDLGAARSIRGANVLVIGLGDIGGAFARMCRALGAAVTGIRRTPAPDPETADRVFGLDQLDALLPSADVVACALPETPQTRGLLNKARLALLKPDAYLVNAGRGSLIDEAALLETLNEGRLAGVALDVLCTEPLPADSPLWHAPRILITPHVAGATTCPMSEKTSPASRSIISAPSPPMPPSKASSTPPPATAPARNPFPGSAEKPESGLKITSSQDISHSYLYFIRLRTIIDKVFFSRSDYDGQGGAHASGVYCGSAS